MAFRMNSAVRQELVNAEIQFRKACEQVVLLSQNVEEATRRYTEADGAGHKVLRYSIRLRLSVLEGVRNMFYEFAAKKAADIVNLQRLVLQTGSDVTAAAGGIPSSDEDDDEGSDVDELLFSSSYEFGHDDVDASSSDDDDDDSFQ